VSHPPHVPMLMHTKLGASSLCRPFPDSSHKFTSQGCDWGFNQFFSLAEINDPAKGWMVDDAVILKVDVRVMQNEK
jgi:hypothetical protein